MKIRIDFVTNSSSSSFLLARKGNGEISKEGRDKLVDLLVKDFIDLSIIDDITTENLAEHEGIEYRDRSVIERARTALSDGFELGEGVVVYEGSDYTLSEMFEKMLNILGEEENYRIVDGDLSY